LNVGGEESDENYISEYEEDEEEESETDPEKEENIFMKEWLPTEEKQPSTPPPVKKSVKKSRDATTEEEYLELIEMRDDFQQKIAKRPHNSKIMQRALHDVKQKIQELIKTAKKQNTKKFYQMTHTHKKHGEIHYFENKLSNKEQLHIVDQMKTISQTMQIDVPYRIRLLQSSIPEKIKALVLTKLDAFSNMKPMDGEYFKLKTWIDNFMKIPFGIYKSLPITLQDGENACRTFLETASIQLDQCVYGMKDVKMQILQLVGQWITNPRSMGKVIALHGPPGTGKTSILKNGVSKIMNRDFAFIPLGGCGDSSFLDGFSYTYEGSTPGQIVQQIIQNKSMNVIFYFDELDKVSDTPRGQEIIGVLTHLMDNTQNNEFHDKYFAEIDFDLSKCIFFVSYNDEKLINPILLDRFHKIKTDAYTSKEKLVIANKYLLPEICKDICIEPEYIVFPDATISYIIDNYTNKEGGVRNLKRCMENIVSKLNLFRLMNPTGELEKYLTLGREVSFPFTLEKADVEKLIKLDQSFQARDVMYI
jgi:ATP-dependent Lon protease